MAKAKSKTKTVPWDSAAHLKTDGDIADYLEAVFEDGDPALLAHALGVIARAKGHDADRANGRPWPREPL